ncbi:putative UDP-glucose 6-dehydrogenase [Tupanvirus soda lake]|uniref:UDP-glucose 6-dehydrogenase n=2 Tax=Tupanvirus TaxID=2094720 RepID=A0AC62ABU7_9VIRU|nr:putative UDP-glucose 6-dehydrogenase [Tupanvirus soda lake]QKU35172.1 putative UDP-glucose 6-dehydrogenase [Tupanvirus soda lake]
MKIGVIGIGTVGGAMYKSLQEKCDNSDVVVIGYDKYKNIGTFEDVLETEMVFLCLPTLYSHEISQYDKSAIHQICANLSNNNYKGLVVIKSTVEPTTSQNIADIYDLSIIHNPEFLSAKTAYEDFHTQKHIVIGSTKQTNPEHLENLINFYKKFYGDADISLCTSTESESIKIFCNNFYSVKIQFFNELYLLCQKLNINYDFVKDTMIKNGWINPMHTVVPGTDNKLSYGGMCFPKDTNALLSFMKLVGTPHQVLEATVLERNSLRDD